MALIITNKRYQVDLTQLSEATGFDQILLFYKIKIKQ
jgi:hypothetical protein